MARAWLALMALAASLPLLAPARSAAAAAAATAEACPPSGKIRYLCGVANAEDLVTVPGTRWLIASGASAQEGAAGGLFLVDSARRSIRPLVPDLSRPARAPYAACPGPIDLKKFLSHGLALRPGARGRHTLYVVNHGGRESVELFGVDASRGEPRLSWLGCVPMPKGANPNSVAPLPDGGFVVSKFDEAGDDKAFQKMIAGEKTGLVYQWSPKSGFKAVPGSELSGDNGVEVSRDGRWIFVNAWPEKRIVRLALDGWGQPAEARVDFMPDNLHWAPDGSLLVAGQGPDLKTLLACDKPHCPHDWAVARLDPKTMQVTPLVSRKGEEAFGDATGAVQLGRELWVGTYKGDRLAIVPIEER